MTGDVVKRAAAGHGGIEEPVSDPIRIVVFEPSVQFASAKTGCPIAPSAMSSRRESAWERAAIVRDREEPMMSRAAATMDALREVHCRWLFA